MHQSKSQKQNSKIVIDLVRTQGINGSREDACIIVITKRVLLKNGLLHKHKSVRSVVPYCSCTLANAVSSESDFEFRYLHVTPKVQLVANS